MAEEQKWQEPGSHRLCANNCGFFGSPTTLNLCSKCYKDHCVKEQNMSTAMLAVEKSLSQPDLESESTPSFASSSSDPVFLPEAASSTAKSASAQAETEMEAVYSQEVTQSNRCATCRKRVGLTGFKCKCGPMFCGTHRYPEQHACTFDFKAVGKEVITKANPIVKANKLQKI